MEAVKSMPEETAFVPQSLPARDPEEKHQPRSVTEALQKAGTGKGDTISEAYRPSQDVRGLSLSGLLTTSGVRQGWAEAAQSANGEK